MTLEPNLEKLPSIYADELGVEYTLRVDVEHKKEFGQYFTPIEIARFMADFCVTDKSNNRIKILDPGCGLGVLSCSLAEALARNTHIKEIEIVAFETDLQIITLAHQSFNYLQKWLKNKGIDFSYFLCANDFVLHNSAILDNKIDVEEFFDIVISNPPYFKVRKNSAVHLATKKILYGQQNIYSIFIIIASKLLKPSGKLVFISPRSFTSGSYFRAFREIFLDLVKIKKVHLFHSRKEAFLRDRVLQENVIVLAERKIEEASDQLKLPILSDSVDISISNGVLDINTAISKSYDLKELVNISSFQKIFHIPTSREDEKALSIFKGWYNTFERANMKISTGPVVAYRAKQYLKGKASKLTVPLIWLNNVDKMKFVWPLELNNKNKKEQYINREASSEGILVENKNYVLIRRFSSKDDRSKLIATPYLRNNIRKHEKIGLENHLNYLYRIDGELSLKEVYGIAALLNSTLFDIYFRTFNGNINVSATELSGLPLPDLKFIHKLGDKIIDKPNLNQEAIDDIVFKIFKLKK